MASIIPSGDELDINRAVELYDSDWDKRSVRINKVEVNLPPLEDILVMKLLAGRKKDMKDIKHVFKTSWARLDKERLLEKAIKVQEDRKLAKHAKLIGYKL